MFDVNPSEIVILAVLAVIIFGPEKLPELARKAARVVNYLRNIANDATGRLKQELGPEFADLDLTSLNPKDLVNRHILNPVQSELQPITAELAPVKASLAAEFAAGSAVVAGTVVEDEQAEPAAARLPVAFDIEAT